MPLQLHQAASPSAVPLTCQNKQTKQTTQRAGEQKDGWMDALACRRTAIWQCGNSSEMYCWTLWMCHQSFLSVSLLFALSEGEQWHSHGPAPTSQTRRLGIAHLCVHETLFKIYEEVSSEMLLESCVFQSVRRWSRSHFVIFIRSPKLCSQHSFLSHLQFTRYRNKTEGGNWAWWQSLCKLGCWLSICLYVWTFNLVKWVIEHSCRYTEPVGWLI